MNVNAWAAKYKKTVKPYLHKRCIPRKNPQVLLERRLA